jgi:hypothetical protein
MQVSRKIKLPNQVTGDASNEDIQFNAPRFSSDGQSWHGGRCNSHSVACGIGAG